MIFFFTGVLIARALPERRLKSRAAWLPMPLLIVLFFLPWQDRDLRDVLIKMLVFPAIIAFAARVEPHGGRLFLLAGRLSYPIYAVHYPLYLCLTYGLLLFGMTPEQLAPWAGTAFAITILILSHVLDRHYDAPVRRWLLDWTSRSAPKAQSAAL